MRNLIFTFIVLTVLLSCTSNIKTSDKSNSLDDQLNELASQISSQFLRSSNIKIAIDEFKDLQGQSTFFGKMLAEELTTKLFKTGKFIIVERQLFNSIMKEQELGINGYIDENTAVSLGNILGVDAITTGTYTDYGNQIKINARVILAETGKIQSVASITIDKTNDISILLAGENNNNSKTTKRHLFKKNGLTLEVKEVEQNTQSIIVTVKISNNKEEDQNLRFLHSGRSNGKYTYSQAYDNKGNILEIEGIEFVEYNVIDLKKYPNFQDITILTGNPKIIKIHLKAQSYNVEKISRLEFICGEYPGYAVKFKNIRIN